MDEYYGRGRNAAWVGKEKEKKKKKKKKDHGEEGAGEDPMDYMNHGMM